MNKISVDYLVNYDNEYNKTILNNCINEILPYVHKAEKTYLEINYMIGVILKKYFPKKYGENVNKKIAENIGRSPQSLNKMRQFADKYTEQEMKILVSGAFTLAWRIIKENLTVAAKVMIEIYQASSSIKEVEEKLSEWKKYNKDNCIQHNNMQTDNGKENQDNNNKGGERPLDTPYVFKGDDQEESTVQSDNGYRKEEDIIDIQNEKNGEASSNSPPAGGDVDESPQHTDDVGPDRSTSKNAPRVISTNINDNQAVPKKDNDKCFSSNPIEDMMPENPQVNITESKIDSLSRIMVELADYKNKLKHYRKYIRKLACKVHNLRKQNNNYNGHYMPTQSDDQLIAQESIAVSH